jgi:hypothetical protein
LTTIKVDKLEARARTPEKLGERSRELSILDGGRLYRRTEISVAKSNGRVVYEYGLAINV